MLVRLTININDEKPFVHDGKPYSTISSCLHSIRSAPAKRRNFHSANVSLKQRSIGQGLPKQSPTEVNPEWLTNDYMMIKSTIRSFIQTYPDIGEAWRQAMMKGTSIVCTEFDVFCVKYKTNVIGKAVEEVIQISTPDEKKELFQRFDPLPIQPRGTLLGRSRVSLSEKMNTRPSAINTKPVLAPVTDVEHINEVRVDRYDPRSPTPILPPTELSICPISREPANSIEKIQEEINVQHVGEPEHEDIRVDMRYVDEPGQGYVHVPIRDGDDVGLAELVTILRDSKKIPEIICDDPMSEALTQQFQLNHIRAAASDEKK